MGIFSNEKINSGRQTEVDLLRGFTALNIIICHVGLYLGNSSNAGLYTFCDISGSEFIAPIFMILMGISMCYSKHQTPAEMFKRGIRFLIIGYALNLYRSIIPMAVFGQVDEWATVEAFFVIDILQFAGITFMFIALLKKIKIPNTAILALSAVMAFINQYLMFPENIAWESELLTGIVNLFVPVTLWSCFPFLTWFFFPAFGLVFGDLLIRCTDKKRLYAVLLPVGLAGVLYVYWQFHCLYPDYTSYYWGNNFYYMGLKNVILTVPFALFSLGFWYFVQNILPDAVKKFLFFLSKNLNTFYIISWLIISVMMHLQAIYKINLSAIETIGMMLMVQAACAILTKLYLDVKSRIRKRKNH